MVIGKGVKGASRSLQAKPLCAKFHGMSGKLICHFSMQNRKEFRSFTNYHTYYCEKVQGIQRSHSIWQGRKVQLNVFEL